MLNSIELKTFVPARDFQLSQAFYLALGFKPGWSDDQLAYFSHGDHCAFLLQNFYVKEQAENFVMHLLVEDVDAWWKQVSEARLDERFGVRLIAPQDQPWGMRDFIVLDPSGVLWRIAQNTRPPYDSAKGAFADE
jgi:catechol 2,3-dioxygenase-like lactoylglutathione lyase family enzyme